MDLIGFWKERLGGIPEPSDFKEVWKGLAAPWRGFVFLKAHPDLWRLAMKPIALNLLITAVVIGLLFYASALYWEHVHDFFADSLWWRLVEIVAIVMAFLLAIVLVVLTWLVLSAILCSYFYSKLARKTLLALGVEESTLKEISVVYQVVDSFRAITVLVVANLLLLLLNLIPVLGSALSVTLSTYFNSYVFGYDYFDYVLELQGLRRKDKLAFVRGHRGSTVGLGATVFVFNFVPIFGAVILTTAVVGAVLLHQEIEQG